MHGSPALAQERVRADQHHAFKRKPVCQICSTHQRASLTSEKEASKTGGGGERRDKHPRSSMLRQWNSCPKYFLAYLADKQMRWCRLCCSHDGCSKHNSRKVPFDASLCTVKRGSCVWSVIEIWFGYQHLELIFESYTAKFTHRQCIKEFKILHPGSGIPRLFPLNPFLPKTV